jgi:hypothetical protein
MDVIVVVRPDEALHRDANHQLADDLKVNVARTSGLIHLIRYGVPVQRVRIGM